MVPNCCCLTFNMNLGPLVRISPRFLEYELYRVPAAKKKKKKEKEKRKEKRKKKKECIKTSHYGMHGRSSSPTHSILAPVRPNVNNCKPPSAIRLGIRAGVHV
jgi:hypothetical protein